MKKYLLLLLSGLSSCGFSFSSLEESLSESSEADVLESLLESVDFCAACSSSSSSEHSEELREKHVILIT